MPLLLPTPTNAHRSDPDWVIAWLAGQDAPSNVYWEELFYRPDN